MESVVLVVVPEVTAELDVVPPKLKDRAGAEVVAEPKLEAVVVAEAGKLNVTADEVVDAVEAAAEEAGTPPREKPVEGVGAAPPKVKPDVADVVVIDAGAVAAGGAGAGVAAGAAAGAAPRVNPVEAGVDKEPAKLNPDAAGADDAAGAPRENPLVAGAAVLAAGAGVAPRDSPVEAAGAVKPKEKPDEGAAEEAGVDPNEKPNDGAVEPKPNEGVWDTAGAAAGAVAGAPKLGVAPAALAAAPNENPDAGALAGAGALKAVAADAAGVAELPKLKPEGAPPKPVAGAPGAAPNVGLGAVIPKDGAPCFGASPPPS